MFNVDHLLAEVVDAETGAILEGGGAVYEFLMELRINKYNM